MKIFWNLFVYQDTENMYLPDKKSVHHIHMIIINKTSERHRISNKHWQLSWIKTYQTNYDFQAAAVTTYYCVTQRQTHTEHTSERTNTSELSHTYTHTLFMCSLTETHLQRSLSLKWPIGLQWEHRGVDQSEEMPYTHLTFHLPKSFSPSFSECFHPWHSYPALVPCFVHLYAWSDRQESEKRVRGAQDIQAGVKRKQLHWLKSVFFSR